MSTNLVHCLGNKPVTATKLTSLLISDLQVASTARNNNKIILYLKSENDYIDMCMYTHRIKSAYHAFLSCCL